jgi:hypothetical protein
VELTLFLFGVSMTDIETDAMRVAIMALKHNLFGDASDADEVCKLFDSWEMRASGYEALCGALCHLMHHAGIDVETTLDNLALHVAGEQ